MRHGVTWDFLSLVTGIHVLKMLRKRNNRDGGEYQWKSRARIGANRGHMQCIMKKSKAPEEVNIKPLHNYPRVIARYEIASRSLY